MKRLLYVAGMALAHLLLAWAVCCLNKSGGESWERSSLKPDINTSTLFP